MTKSISTIAVALLVFVTLACGNSGSQVRDDHDQNQMVSYESWEDVTSRLATLEDRVEALEDPPQTPILLPDTDMVAPVKLENPWEPHECAFRFRTFTGVQLTDVLPRWRECDPVAKNFDMDGKLKNRGYGFLTSIQSARDAVMNTGAPDLFESLSPLKKRELVEEALPLIVEYVLVYVHEDHVNDWLLDLEWERDIARLNPDWYKDPWKSYPENQWGDDWDSRPLYWPTDRTEKIEIPGYGSVSRLDFWVRAFWKRRGEALFEAIKAEVEEQRGASLG